MKAPIKSLIKPQMNVLIIQYKALIEASSKANIQALMKTLIGIMLIEVTALMMAVIRALIGTVL